MSDQKIKRVIAVSPTLWEWARRYGNATAYIEAVLEADRKQKTSKVADNEKATVDRT
jgi:hypothetical protein